MGDLIGFFLLDLQPGGIGRGGLEGTLKQHVIHLPLVLSLLNRLAHPLNVEQVLPLLLKNRGSRQAKQRYQERHQGIDKHKEEHNQNKRVLRKIHHQFGAILIVE